MFDILEKKNVEKDVKDGNIFIRQCFEHISLKIVINLE